jgi:long-chain acyl-CoA synthetase
MQFSHNPPSIIDCFCKYEVEKPDALFLSEPVNGVYQEFTWKSAGAEIRKMAAVLEQKGLKKGDKVAILSKNCAFWVMADLAILMAGCVPVPLYPNSTPQSLNQILVHSDSQLIFIGKLDNPGLLQQAVPAGMPQISFPFYPITGTEIWTELTSKQEPLQGKPLINKEDLACIIYTSGTTGMPKGVVHKFESMSFAVDAFLQTNPTLRKEIFFSYLPLCHVAEKMLVECGTIFTGSSMYFVESMDSFTKNLQHTKPTVFLAVPRIWEKMREEILKKMPQAKLDRILRIPLISTLFKRILRKKLGFSRANFIFTGASPINPLLLEWFKKLDIEIMEAYGMTENMALSHANKKGQIKFGTVGTSYPGVEVRLGADQEVQVKSKASMVGYYKEPQLSAESFIDGYLRTGDQGSLDAEGFLTIIGRTKDQFKTSKGKYVSPAPIESKILENSFIDQACVVGHAMPSAMVICILSPQGRAENASNLRLELSEHLQKVNDQLEPHEKLSKMVLLKEEWTIDNGILTPTLKIKRKSVDQQYQDQYANWQSQAESVIILS